MNVIDPVQQNYYYKVGAVNLFENRNRGDANIFNQNLFRQQPNGEYNLEHPKVAGSETQARHLDFLA